MEAEHAHETQADLRKKTLVEKFAHLFSYLSRWKAYCTKVVEHSSTCCQQWLRAAEGVASDEYLIQR